MDFHFGQIIASPVNGSGKVTHLLRNALRCSSRKPQFALNPIRKALSGRGHRVRVYLPAGVPGKGILRLPDANGGARGQWPGTVFDLCVPCVFCGAALR